MSDILINVDELKFDERGLIPAIVTDYATRRVLMLAYMNRESLQISIEKGLTCFWSRSRQQLWTKGETSGNYQHIISITADCDRDTLLIAVKADGPACHMGTTSCFEYPVWESDEQEEFSIDGLYKMIEGRKVIKRRALILRTCSRRASTRSLRRWERNAPRSLSRARRRIRRRQSMRFPTWYIT